MARTVTSKVIEKPVIEEQVHLNCDRCDKEISHDPLDDDSYAQRLEIYLNPELCVNSLIRQDLCRQCLEPIWQAICGALGIDPDDEHRIGDEDW